MESKSRARAASAVLWLAPLVLATQGCGFPAPEACALACGELGACPGGFECQASSQLCVPIGTREACLSAVVGSNQPDRSTGGALSGVSTGGAGGAASTDAGPLPAAGSGGAPDAGEPPAVGGGDGGGDGPAPDELSISLDSALPGSSCSGSELSRALRASGGVSPYAWQIVTAPEGVQLSSERGNEVQLTGVPEEPGSIVVEIEDGQGNVSSLELEVYESPRLLSSQLPALCAGQAYAAPLLASGGNSEDYVWSAQLVPASGLPRSLAELGLSLQGATLSAEASAPIAAQSGVRVALAVRDAHCSSAPLEAELEVVAAGGAECPSLQLSTPPDALPDACLGNFYAEALTAAGGEPPYLWSALSVPPGLHFDAEAALLSGVPEGDGVLELQLSDERGRTLLRSYELHARARCWLAYIASEPAAHLELVDPVLLERQPESARRALPEGPDPVLDFQFSPDGRHIAYRVASGAGPVRLELASLADGETHALELGGAVGAYAWSPDSATLAAAFTSAQQARLGGVDVAGDGRLLESRAVAGVPSRLSWYDASHVALLTPDPEVSSLYWLATAERAAGGYASPVAHVEAVFSQAAQLIGGAGGVFVSDRESGLFEFFPSAGSAPSAHASAAVVAPSGAFAGLARDGALQAFRPFQSSALADPAIVPFASAAGCDSLLAWGQDRERIACAAGIEGDAELALFELGSGGALSSSVLPLAGIGASGQRRTFSQSARWFAAASADQLYVVNTSGRPRLWATLPSAVLGTTPGALAFSPDDSFLLIGAGNALELLDLRADPVAPRQLSASALIDSECNERFLDGQWCGSAALDSAPFWSSDSDWVAFRSVLGTLQLIEVTRAGEPARSLSPDSVCSEACRSGSSARFQP